MANRFWVDGTGNWSDNTNHWSATTGGDPNASKPTSADSVYFDANSFDGASQTVTVDEIASCLDMDWTGATNTPTLGGTFQLIIYGSLTFIAAMLFTKSGSLYFSPAGSVTVTVAGHELSSLSFVVMQGVGIVTLQDDFDSTGNDFHQVAGTVDTNGNTFTCGAMNQSYAGARTLTLGASVINCTSWLYSGSNLTLNANTSIIKVTGTGVFAGGGLIYNNVELNGTAHTISGSNTFNTLKIGRTSAVTITGTAATTQTVRHLQLGNTINVVTLASTGAVWTLTGNVGFFGENYMDISDVTAGYPQIYYAGRNSTDGGSTANWIFNNPPRSAMWTHRR